MDTGRVNEENEEKRKDFWKRRRKRMNRGRASQINEERRRNRMKRGENKGNEVEKRERKINRSGLRKREKKGKVREQT